ncbi:MAG: heavy-metal-associated domain-containing protein [Anaerolineae bacterium]|nr:heavy-metal-associated domain-containing protein [Gloeobacterales cyanobacterium ES-bin-313]
MQIELKIDGMTCNGCQAGVTRILKAQKDVTEATVDLVAGRAVIEGNADPQQLIRAVIAAGYDAQLV